jgi:rhodanese-related sulfurtransferase
MSGRGFILATDREKYHKEIGMVDRITVFELKKRLDNKEPLILLDVREASELSPDFGYLPGITHIPIGELARRLNELDNLRDIQIITICYTGGRSHVAAELLQKEGFPNVALLCGGMLSWIESGFPVNI